MSLTSLSAKIHETWRHAPGVKALCLNLLRFAATPPVKEYITLSALMAAAKVGSQSEEFGLAVQYLLGDIVPVFDLAFEIDDVEGNPVRITSEDVYIAQTDSINPLTGEVEENITQKIVTVFSVSKVIREIIAGD